MDQPNLTVLVHTQVSKLVFSGNTVIGVEVIQGSYRSQIMADREVILSVGAINTPKVLMQSGIGPEDELCPHGIPVVQQLPGVGRNHQDHVSFACIFESNEPVAVGNGGSEATLYWKTDPSLGWMVFAGLSHPKSRGSLHLTGPDAHDPLPIEANTLARHAQCVRDRKLYSQFGGDVLAPGMHCEDGARFDVRRERAVAGSWRRPVTYRRCLDHAQCPQRQYDGSVRRHRRAHRPGHGPSHGPSRNPLWFLAGDVLTGACVHDLGRDSSSLEVEFTVSVSVCMGSRDGAFSIKLKACAAISSILLSVGIARAALGEAASPAPAAPLPERLSATSLFVNGSTTIVRSENQPFSPQYPLWSDGATKRRWIYLPSGTFVDAARADAWEFPPGTRLWKEFSFGTRRIETRLIERLQDGSWRYATYVWNDDGSDAMLAPADGLASLRLSDTHTYSIPSETDCRACHEGASVPVLGFTALQLSPDRDPLAPHAELHASDVDLRTLIARGLVRNLPHALCGHCHSAIRACRCRPLAHQRSISKPWHSSSAGSTTISNHRRNRIHELISIEAVAALRPRAGCRRTCQLLCCR
jgi:hypothetical protein